MAQITINLIRNAQSFIPSRIGLTTLQTRIANRKGIKVQICEMCQTGKTVEVDDNIERVLTSHN